MISQTVNQATVQADAAHEDPRLSQPAARADLLGAIAGELRNERTAVVSLAREETQLAEARLEGELERTVRQLEMFAALTVTGEFHDAVIDLPDPEAKPIPRPDLRRVKLPRGPVAVFGAGNFPLAFGVAGGDTASALATGCPVVSKSHPGHRETDQLVADLIDRAIERTGHHPGAHGLIHADDPAEAGSLVEAPEISAVAFTGSTAGGLALAERARQRDVPIPMYAEMGSINPAIVTPATASRRGEAVAASLADAVLNSGGQLCTKPGLILLPADAAGDRMSAELARRIGSAQLGPMLSDAIRARYVESVEAMNAVAGLEQLGNGDGGGVPSPEQAGAHVWETSVDTACRNERARAEVFGPAALLVRYESEADLLRLVEHLEGQLSVSVFSEPSEAELVRRLIHGLKSIAGRLVFDAPTTGVAVSMAQHHGGPFPATSDDAYTSVGGTATERFVSPVAFQDCPAALLPEPVQDENPLGIWRTINGIRSRDPVAR